MAQSNIAKAYHPIARRGILLLLFIAFEMVEHRTEVEALAVLGDIDMQTCQRQTADIHRLANEPQQAGTHVKRVEAGKRRCSVLLVNIETAQGKMASEKIYTHMRHMYLATGKVLTVRVDIALRHRSRQQRNHKQQCNHYAYNPQQYLDYLFHNFFTS